jgi:hypothetical protein
MHCGNGWTRKRGKRPFWHTPMVKVMAISMAFSSGIEPARATKVQGDIGCDISS